MALSGTNLKLHLHPTKTTYKQEEEEERQNVSCTTANASNQTRFIQEEGKRELEEEEEPTAKDAFKNFVSGSRDGA